MEAINCISNYFCKYLRGTLYESAINKFENEFGSKIDSYRLKNETSYRETIKCGISAKFFENLDILKNNYASGGKLWSAELGKLMQSTKIKKPRNDVVVFLLEGVLEKTLFEQIAYHRKLPDKEAALQIQLIKLIDKIIDFLSTNNRENYHIYISGSNEKSTILISEFKKFLREVAAEARSSSSGNTISTLKNKIKELEEKLRLSSGDYKKKYFKLASDFRKTTKQNMKFKEQNQRLKDENQKIRKLLQQSKEILENMKSERANTIRTFTEKEPEEQEDFDEEEEEEEGEVEEEFENEEGENEEESEEEINLSDDSSEKSDKSDLEF